MEEVLSELKSHPSFEHVEFREYFDNVHFTCQGYADLVQTYGWVQVLPEEQRGKLLKELRELLAYHEEPPIIPHKWVLTLVKKYWAFG